MRGVRRHLKARRNRVAAGLNSRMLPTSGKLHKLNTGLVTSCIVGLALSYYAYVVETAKEQDDTYEALCDISERISCTKAFMSEYGKGFGVIPVNSIFHLPNSLYGLGFYALFSIISVFNNCGHSVVLVMLAVLSNFTSIYLAWILYLLNDICVICISTYVVNAIILVLSYCKLQVLFKPIAQKSTKKKKH